MDLDETAEDLVAAGYERVDQVEDRGQFAIRGGLLDLFPATEDRAVRVDLFGDEIESLRWFSTFTQRSLGDAEEVEVAPAAELALEYRELAEIAALEKQEDRPDIAELLPVEDFKPFLELIAADAQVLIAAEEEVAPALADHWQDVTAAFHDAEAHHLYVAPDAITAALDARARIRLSSIDQDQPFQFRAQAAEVGAARHPRGRAGAREAAALRLPHGRRLRRSAARASAPPTTSAASRSSWLEDESAVMLVRLDQHQRRRLPQLTFAHARLREGFIAPQFKLAVIPEHRLFRRRRAPEGPAGSGGAACCARSPSCAPATSSSTRTTGSPASPASTPRPSPASPATTCTSSTPARTASSCRSTSSRRSAATSAPAASTRRSPSSAAPAGRRSRRGRARPPRSMAGELLNLYAERKRREGHAFPPDTDWQREFEENFAYTETPDQRDAIEFVKADMEAPRPMDRLICGDVGYGKTEVALRAAFKAVQDGKQVMVLVPTTILAQQHYGTFSERLKDYPVRIEHVSRFRPAAEQKEAVAAFGERRGRHPDRHPPAALARRARQGPRAADRRRGAALRGQAEGAAAPDEAEGRRDRDERDADPAHAADVARRDPRHHRDRDRAGGAAPGQDLRRRVRRGAGQGGAAAREGARRPGVLPAQPRRVDRRDRRAPARALSRRCASRSPTGRWRTRELEQRMLALPARRRRRAGRRPRSSSRGSTSRRPTR